MARILDRIRLWALAAGVALFLLVTALGHAGASIGPKGLEARLLAPCCYGGTLDVHDSELARDLRKEIEDRMARGESAEVIEADFVSRYGTKVRALPTEGALTTSFGLTFAAIFAAAAILFWRIRARAERAPAAAVATSSPIVRDAFDDKLDDELADREY